MARFLYWTDLHLEIEDFLLPEISNIDAILLGGDTCKGRDLASYCGMLFDIYQVPVIAILGNHEGYGREWYEMVSKLTQEFNSLKDRQKDIHLLNPGIVDIKDTRIIGATLWSDLNIHGKDNPISELAVLNGLNDYQKIHINQGGMIRKLTIMDTKKWHEKDKSFIFDSLKEPFDGKRLVLTHHQPTAQSIHPKFKGTAINPGFASAMDEDVSNSQADYWLCGHAHLVVSYEHEKSDGTICSIISNCRGYPREYHSTNFNPQFVIDTSL